MKTTLRIPLLRQIIAAYGINRLGNWFGALAISLAVFDHTHSALDVAIVLVAAQVVPAFTSLPLVSRVETSKNKHIFSYLFFMEAVLTAAIAGLIYKYFSLPLIFILVALDGTIAIAASGLMRAALARAAREKRSDEDGDLVEREANAALNVIFTITFIAGPALAGIIVGVAGAPTALLIDAVTFVVCGLLLLSLSLYGDTHEGDSVKMRLAEVWQYISETPTLKGLLVAQAIGFIFFTAGEPVEVAFVKATLHAGDSGLGILVGFWGVGAFFGSLIFARSKAALHVLVTLGTLAVGVAFIGIGISPTLALACVFGVVGGVGNGIQWAPLVSAIQLVTPSFLHGRVMGLLESIGAVFATVGLLLGGVLVSAASSRTAFWVIGIGAIITAAMFARIPVKQSTFAMEAELVTE